MCLFQRPILNLLAIPRFLGMEYPPGQVGKTLVADFGGELQFPCAQCLVLQPQFAVGGVVAVLAVAQNGAADMRQMRTDLVGASSDQLHFQQGQPSADG